MDPQPKVPVLMYAPPLEHTVRIKGSRTRVEVPTYDKTASIVADIGSRDVLITDTEGNSVRLTPAMAATIAYYIARGEVI